MGQLSKYAQHENKILGIAGCTAAIILLLIGREKRNRQVHKSLNETDKRKIESYKHILLVHGNYEQI